MVAVTVVWMDRNAFSIISRDAVASGLVWVSVIGMRGAGLEGRRSEVWRIGHRGWGWEWWVVEGTV